jgi:hypothetical protein
MKRKTIAVTTIVKTTLINKALMTATACALSWGKNRITPTAAGMNKTPKCWLNASDTKAKDELTWPLMIKKINKNIKPNTGPGIMGKKKCDTSSPKPCHNNIWTKPGIIFLLTLL